MFNQGSIGQRRNEAISVWCCICFVELDCNLWITSLKREEVSDRNIIKSGFPRLGLSWKKGDLIPIIID